MFDVKKVELEWAGKKLKIETGKIARQADSSVVVTYGGTTVMANVVAAKQVKPDMDFFPLTCLLYTSPSPRDLSTSRMPSSA